MKKTLGVLAVLAMAAAAQAGTIDFNVYNAGDAGGQSLANKSWVAGSVNIGAGATAIGGGTTITLQDQTFDTGATKNYGVVTDNTIGVFGLGANTTGEGGTAFSASVTGTGITSVSIYFGNYEGMDSTPVVFLPGVANSWSGWSGSVSGTLSNYLKTVNRYRRRYQSSPQHSSIRPR